MTAPTPYLHFDGTARAALTFYQRVFGGELSMYANGEMGRGGEADGVGHGILEGPVSLFAADAEEGQEPFVATGLMLALLGTAAPAVLHEWFAALGENGVVVDDLQQRPWGASDGQVRDQFGVLWLIGYEPAK